MLTVRAMGERLSSAESGEAVPRGPIPPHAQFEDFLAESGRSALLDWTLANQAEFKEAKVFYRGGTAKRLDPNVRQALRHVGAGPFEALLEERLLDALPQVMAAAAYSGPEPRSIELELVAYGEGAHFAPHIDIPVGAARTPTGKEKGEDRLITAVYYFHREPKAFSGGKLRLYRFGADASDPALNEEGSIAFEPIQNSLLVFPSWAQHSVERVSCPSGRFADYRFAINCWFCRPTAG